jgi:hypothetical protein
MGLSKEKIDKIENELSSEKGFWSVVKSCFEADKLTAKYILFLVVVLLVNSLLCYPIIIFSETADVFVTIFDIGFLFSISILGFLITGFSIYSTFLDKDLMFFLISYTDTGDKFNKFHKNYLFFFKPFLVFLIILSFSIIGKISASSWKIYRLIFEKYFIKYNLINFSNLFWAVIIGIYLTLLVISISTLKDFIYNIYTSAKTIGRFEVLRRSCKCDLETLVTLIEKQQSKEE